VEAVGPATELPHCASLVPIVGRLRLGTLREDAILFRWSNAAWALYILEWPLLAEAALDVNAICKAPEHAMAAPRVPEVRHEGLIREGACLRGWISRARNIFVAALATESTPYVNSISEATVHALRALWIPEVRGPWLNLEGASNRGRGCHNIWASNAGEGVFTTKAALCVNTIGPTTQHSHLASIVPKVWDHWLVWEVATRRGTRYVGISIRPAEATSDILAIGIAPQHAHLTSRIPKVTWTDRLILKITTSQTCRRSTQSC